MMIRPSGITISLVGTGGNPAESRPVIARIFGFAQGLDEPVSHELIVAAGARVEQKLSEGLYNVELTLPSGRLLQRNVRISEDTHEDFQFLDDFGSATEVSLQEAVGGADGDVLSRVKAHGMPEESLQGEAPPRQSPGQGANLSGYRGGLFRTGTLSRARAAHKLVPTQLRPEVSLAIKYGGLPDTWSTMPDDNDWVFLEPKDTMDGRQLWRIQPGEISNPVSYVRQWARIKRPDGSAEIASLPLPWFCSNPPNFTTADILFDPARSIGASMTVAINDVALSGLLSFLDRGQAAAAGPILETIEMHRLIEDTIYGKMGNPLAACAAGYVGLAALPADRRQRYDTWLKNCMERFPSIPDAAIINARRLVLRPRTADDNNRAAQALRQAVNAGIPYFSAGVVLLREMLLQLSYDHPDLKPLADKVELLVGRVDVTQAFTVLRFAPAAKE